MLLREPLSRSQTADCNSVQAGAVKALAGSSTHKTNLVNGETLSALPFTIAAPTMVLGLRWLCSLMHTSGSRSAFRAGLISDCSVLVLGSSSGRTFRQRTPRASGPRASHAVCHGSRARPRAAARHDKSSTVPSGSPL